MEANVMRHQNATTVFFLFSATLFMLALTGCPPITVTVTPNAITLEAGQTATLSASSTSDADTAFAWGSNNIQVATVQAGVVTAHQEGSAVITATGISSGKHGNAVVTVIPSPVEGETEGEGIEEGEEEGTVEGEGIAEGEGIEEGEEEGIPEGEGTVEGEGAAEGEGEGVEEGEEEGESMTIFLQERGGVDHVAEYVSFGIPLPRSWNVTDVSALRLSDASKAPLPAQFDVLARWGAQADDGDAPIKWVLAGCLAGVAANTTGTLTLDHSGPGPVPATQISVDTSMAGHMAVNTGTAQFDLLTDESFNVINQVTINGSTLLEPLSAPDAIDYVPLDAAGIVPGAAPDFTPRAAYAVVERAGALCTIVRVMGSILDSSDRALLDFTARLHFYAGRSEVRVDFTVENNQPVEETLDGQPGNVHSQGAHNSVYIGGLWLNLRLRDTGAALQGMTIDNVNVNAPETTLELYQDSSGTEHWDVYTGLVGWPGYEASAAPRLQSYCTLPGYRISGGGLLAPLSGGQALGWMSAARSGVADPRLTTVVRDFWQNFPKALELQPDGTLSVNLFPNGEKFRHNFRVGEEKTHTILYKFSLGAPLPGSLETAAQAFNSPLFGKTSPSRYIGSGALGEVPAANLAQWPLYERYTRTAFEPNPDAGPEIVFGNTTLREVIEKYDFYGWQDYGDVPLDYEAFGPNQAGQMNLKYWYLYGMLVQFCRTGDLRWMELARPAAWHLADIDYLHIPDEGIQHWAHGAYFGHSQHDEPGNTNPNRNYNSPSVDLFFGVPELFMMYHLTGEQRFADTAMEGLEAMLNLSQFSDFTNPVFYRERANLIFAYIEGYRHSGDARWLNALRTIVGETANTANKPWLTNPNAYRPGGEERLSVFQFAQTLWTLGRYLDFCTEYGLPDDLGAGAALVTYGDFVINHLMNEYLPGRASTIDSIWFFDPGYETYQEINNWALVTADILAYAYKYSGQARFMTEAAKFYATGTIDPQWQDDPAEYYDTKGLVNALNWGLVYMNQQ